MRKRYVLDAERREAPAGAEAPSLAAEAPGWAGRRWVWVALLGALGALAAGFAAWQVWMAPPAAPVAAPAAPVPEHQRTGPLANPWGNEAPVTASRAEEAAAAAAAASAASAASAVSAASATPGAEAAAARGNVPPAHEAVRQALVRLRGSGNAAAFVATALQSGETAALAVAWMAERQCRQALHWGQMLEWRANAMPERAAGPGAGPGRGAGPGAAASCQAMPDAALLEAALSSAGFPPAHDATPELTRRPIDFALAVAVGDPLLLAEVLEASDGSRVDQQLQAWGADTRDLVSPEVQRAAVWLASCMPLDATGRPSNGALLKPDCRDHPALRQACMGQGLCDARDLRDLLLRTLQANELGAAERLARWLAPRMGR